MRLDGLILQSPALNYASNCDVNDTPNISCAGYISSYGAVGVHFVLTTPLPSSLSGFIDELRGFTDSSYAPAVNAVLSGAAAPSNLLPRLVGYTGLPTGAWQAQFNQGPGGFRNGLLPGRLLGRYDARMADTIPDLATPFHQTELDLARLGAGPSFGLGLVSQVTVRNYAGGHMSYLDDSSRAQQKADLAAFYRATPLQRSATALAFKPHAKALADSAGVPGAAAPVPQAAIQAPLRDPWVARPDTFQAPR